MQDWYAKKRLPETVYLLFASSVLLRMSLYVPVLLLANTADAGA